MKIRNKTFQQNTSKSNNTSERAFIMIKGDLFQDSGFNRYKSMKVPHQISGMMVKNHIIIPMDAN